MAVYFKNKNKIKPNQGRFEGAGETFFVFLVHVSLQRRWIYTPLKKNPAAQPEIQRRIKGL